MFSKKFDLTNVLAGCQRGRSGSQRKLYEHFYGYAMSICLRYTHCREEAAEILNDTFFKVLTQVDHYDPAYPFRPWLRRILINTAIDYHRRAHLLPTHEVLDERLMVCAEEMPMPHLNDTEDVLPILQQLSPAYRLVFNLSVMEGYRHQEIAEMLGISVSTSRANLVRAKHKLRELMLARHPHLTKTD